MALSGKDLGKAWKKRCCTLLATVPLLCAPAARAQGLLKVFFVDVEGGQATLFVTPEGKSLLIDTGWPGNGSRDANRIAAAAQRAGVQKLDYVLLTHYHEDHTGGVPQLVAKLPVGTFLDHGPNRELDHGITEKDYAEYGKVLASTHARHVVMRPGQTLAIGGLTLKVISADGQLLAQSLPGAGAANPGCAASQARAADQTENARSLGVALTYGKLRLLDLGDLTWDKEMQLECPKDKLGHQDVLIVSHHGWNQSSSPALVWGVHPRVAIMDNGEKKGGSLPTFQTLQKSPGLEALWQLHYSAEAGPANTPVQFIANPKGSDPGNAFELDGGRDGGFSVTNLRTGQTKIYDAPAASATAGKR